MKQVDYSLSHLKVFVKIIRHTIKLYNFVIGSHNNEILDSVFMVKRLRDTKDISDYRISNRILTSNSL